VCGELRDEIRRIQLDVGTSTVFVAELVGLTCRLPGVPKAVTAGECAGFCSSTMTTTVATLAL
jgi:hypothetical protein